MITEWLTTSVLSTTHTWPTIHQLKTWTLMAAFNFNISCFLIYIT